MSRRVFEDEGYNGGGGVVFKSSHGGVMVMIVVVMVVVVMVVVLSLKAVRCKITITMNYKKKEDKCK